MKIASVAEVKAKLSGYIKASKNGPVIVTKNGKPVAGASKDVTKNGATILPLPQAPAQPPMPAQPPSSQVTLIPVPKPTPTVKPSRRSKKPPTTM